MTELRQRIASELPMAAFAPQPRRLAIYVILVAIVVLLNGLVFVTTARESWGLSLLLSVALGNAYISLFFAGHEIAHGAVLRSRTASMALLYPPLMIFCMSPHLWLVWHNYVHHTFTNVAGVDPDHFGTIDEFRKEPLKSITIHLIPGSLRLMGILYFLVGFTAQGQVVLWVRSRHPAFRRLRRRTAYIETFLMMSLWVAIGAAVGLRAAILMIIVPMLIANAVNMAYFVTNHLLNPVVTQRDILETSRSVSTAKIFDVLHLNSSYHLEHHLFPYVRGNYLPMIRSAMQRVGERGSSPAHWLALWRVITTPRVYCEGGVLLEPSTGVTVRIDELFSDTK